MDANKPDQEPRSPEIETPNQPEPSGKPMSLRKPFMIFGVIIIFILVGIAVYMMNKQLSQKQTKTIVVPSIITSSPPHTSIKPKDFVFRGVPMSPGYQDGQVWMYERYLSQQLKKSEVVVFTDPSDGRIMAKRIIGLPEDTLMVKDGNVILNGQILNENTYMSAGEKTTEGSFLHEGITVTVPQGSYFIMGDNRPYSSDSREWGFVPNDKIIGILTTQIKPIHGTQDTCQCWDTSNNICLPQIACQ